MDFIFSGTTMPEKDRKTQRFFERVPAFVSWSIILGMTVLAVTKPFAAAMVMIAFYLYWLMRMIYVTIFLIASYVKLSAENRSDWMAKTRTFDEKAGGTSTPLSTDIHHLVIIPVVKEGAEVIEPGIKSLANSSFPTEQIVVIYALEGRASKEVKADVERIKENYKNRFCDLFVVEHPDGIIGEAKAKGANTTYAGKKAAEYFKKKGIPFENIVSSCFDSDTVVNKDYFAALTYYYLDCPERTRASFQPVPVYNNNIWDAPGITRVLEVGSSFFQLIEATNPQTLVTFSSHSMSFKALVDIGFWPVDMISDDSAIFWKAFLHYDGDYKAIPMYTTLSMDAVVADTWWQTVVNVYKQKRRWAWGVENFPIVMRGFLKNKKISLGKKLKYTWKLFEGHISWSTWAFLLTFVGWLPAIFATREYSHSVFYYSAPRITGVIFNLASFSLITSIVLSVCLLPKQKGKKAIIKRVGYAFQWLLMPLTFIFLSALPALDAQTRLFLGKYMTFWVTDKGKK